ncbi:NRR repressor homolog 1-like [Zingiber officinale]|uniref:NRR repressor homolog 1-like n=1 Tax=Zingiber officinale TaxID=94328 RepID=UPI001C4CB2F3|nr:NRR repressor homolog 1-like [Zingiber officinale]
MEEESCNKDTRGKRAAVDDGDSDMEKFYALMENIKAARDSLRGRHNCSKRAKAKASLPRLPAWQPKFELEDFADVEASGSAGRQRSQQEEGDGKEKEEEEENRRGEQKRSLDLRLSL